MGDQHLSNDLLLQILDEQQSSSRMLGDIQGTIGKMQGDIQALSGPDGRVTKIEKEHARQQWQSWLKSLLAPIIMLVGHGVARKMNIDV